MTAAPIPYPVAGSLTSDWVWDSLLFYYPFLLLCCLILKVLDIIHLIYYPRDEGINRHLLSANVHFRAFIFFCCLFVWVEPRAIRGESDKPPPKRDLADRTGGSGGFPRTVQPSIALCSSHD